MATEGVAPDFKATRAHVSDEFAVASTPAAKEQVSLLRNSSHSFQRLFRCEGACKFFFEYAEEQPGSQGEPHTPRSSKLRVSHHMVSR